MDEIRARLHKAPPRPEAARLGDSGVWDDIAPAAPPRPAAVLVPIVSSADPHVLLTRRADSLRTHRGQVAFPGGRLEAGETPWRAALREAEEEIGLARGVPERLGYLDPYITVTGFVVQPCVAAIPQGLAYRPDPVEVADVFTVPLGFLADRANHEVRRGRFRGRERVAHAMPYQGFDIWGATAGMIRNMVDLLHGAEDGVGIEEGIEESMEETAMPVEEAAVRVEDTAVRVEEPGVRAEVAAWVD